MPASHNVPLKDIVDLTLRGEDQRPVHRGDNRGTSTNGGYGRLITGKVPMPGLAPKVARILCVSERKEAARLKGPPLRESMPLDRDESLSAEDGRTSF